MLSPTPPSSSSSSSSGNDGKKRANAVARRRWLEAYSKVRFAVRAISIWQTVLDKESAAGALNVTKDSRRRRECVERQTC